MFKKICTFAILSMLSLNGFAQDSTSSTTDPWQLDFHLYSRFAGIGGSSVDKDAGDAAGAMFLRFRPWMGIKKGAFTAQFGVGSDIYMGQGDYATPGGGGYHIGAAGETPTGIIKLRQANIGFNNEKSGFYGVFGMQYFTVPDYDDDIEGGVTFGWKNDKADIQMFYFGMSMGGDDGFIGIPDPEAGYSGSLFDQTASGGFFGVKATVKASEGLTINPYLISMFQRKNAWQAYGGLISSSWGYGSKAMFQGGIGLIPGVELNYTAGNFNLKANFIMTYGHNEFYGDGTGEDGSDLINQTRIAGAIKLDATYTKPDVYSAGMFFDYRSGDSDSGRNSGHNNSFNGAILEYDASKAPLLILYDAGNGRVVPAYDGVTPDAFAFSDLGAVTLGGSASYTVGGYTITANLGYAWYGATEAYMSSSAMGFEFDLNQTYQIADGFNAFLEFGFLSPGKGLKEYSEGGSGDISITRSLRSQTPWLINAGIKFSL